MALAELHLQRLQTRDVVLAQHLEGRIDALRRERARLMHEEGAEA